jgi:hypothetical protein
MVPLHCKKRGLVIVPSPAGMSLTKLSLAKNNFIIPCQRQFVSRLGTGKSLTFFYSVALEMVVDGQDGECC